MNRYFNMVYMIAWFSLILFLLDYANRTGDWWFNLIGLSVFIFTCIGAWSEILKKHSQSKLKESGE